MKKLKILHLIDSFNLGGAQELVLSLVKGINKDEFEMDIACLYGWGIYANEIKLYAGQTASLSMSKYNLRLPFSLFSRIEKGHYDVLHLHLEFSTLLGAFFGYILGQLKGIPKIVTTVHLHRYQVSAWHYYLALGLPSFMIDKYIVWCGMLHNELKSIRINEQKIVRINQGVNCHLVKWDNKARNLRKELQISADTPVLLSVARLHRQRCLDFIIRSMRLVADQNPQALLVLAGSGPEESALRKLTNDLRLNDNVVFLGLRRDLPNLFSNCDIYVTLSLDEEIGVAGKQAMTYAKPIVAVNKAGLDKKQVLEKTKYLITAKTEKEMAEELLDLLRNPNKKRTMGLKAKHFIEENYSHEAFVRNHERFYPTLLR
ncbi:MAG: glycosyltransferase [Candidatus Schekmanbacteria bacterium]|nr:glycosyltransferase [Candidatus Schekmanbacteria bacterium]